MRRSFGLTRAIILILAAAGAAAGAVVWRVLAFEAEPAGIAKAGATAPSTANESGATVAAEAATPVLREPFDALAGGEAADAESAPPLAAVLDAADAAPPARILALEVVYEDDGGPAAGRRIGLACGSGADATIVEATLDRNGRAAVALPSADVTGAVIFHYPNDNSGGTPLRGTVAAGADEARLVVPGARLRIRLRTEDGAPLSGLAVEAYQNGARYSVATDEKGVADFRGLAPGVATLKNLDFRVVDESGSRGAVPIEIGGAPLDGLAQACPSLAVPGEVAVVLRLLPRVRGRVVDERGEPIPFAWGELRARVRGTSDFSVVAKGSAGEDGRFSYETPLDGVRIAVDATIDALALDLWAPRAEACVSFPIADPSASDVDCGDLRTPGARWLKFVVRGSDDSRPDWQWVLPIGAGDVVRTERRAVANSAEGSVMVLSRPEDVAYWVGGSALVDARVAAADAAEGESTWAGFFSAKGKTVRLERAAAMVVRVAPGPWCEDERTPIQVRASGGSRAGLAADGARAGDAPMRERVLTRKVGEARFDELEPGRPTRLVVEFEGEVLYDAEVSALAAGETRIVELPAPKATGVVELEMSGVLEGFPKLVGREGETACRSVEFEESDGSTDAPRHVAKFFGVAAGRHEIRIDGERVDDVLVVAGAVVKKSVVLKGRRFAALRVYGWGDPQADFVDGTLFAKATFSLASGKDASMTDSFSHVECEDDGARTVRFAVPVGVAVSWRVDVLGHVAYAKEAPGEEVATLRIGPFGRVVAVVTVPAPLRRAWRLFVRRGAEGIFEKNGDVGPGARDLAGVDLAPGRYEVSMSFAAVDGVPSAARVRTQVVDVRAGAAVELAFDPLD